MNPAPNPIGGLFYLLLIVLSIFAVIGAKGKWIAINLGIIIFFIAAGLGIGLGLAVWGGIGELGGHIAFALMPLLGSVGAFGCIRRNKRCNTAAAS